MKKCSECGLDKSLTEYSKNSAKKDGYQQACKTCSSKRFKEYYNKNRDHHKSVTYKRSKRLRERNRALMLEYLSDKSCIDCGESDSVVLEFDHLRDKEMGVSTMMGTGYSWDAILLEIEKCEIVCANCHKRRTAKQFNWYKQ